MAKRTVTSKLNLIGISTVMLLLFLCLAPLAQAADFNPVEDSYVDESSPGGNNGSNTRLRNRGPGSGNQQISYMKFNVSGLSGPVTSATLQLYANSGTGDPVTAYEVSDTSWTEMGITWSNAPALGASLDTIAVTNGVYNVWDVSSAVTGDGTYTIALQGTLDIQQSLRSREHGSPPILTVNTAASSGDFTIGSSPYATEDMIVYRESAAENSIVNDGSVDVTDDIQAMIDSANAAGGGTVFLEEGTYRIDGSLVISPGVTLRGVWEEPTPGQPINGTVMAIYGGRNSNSVIPAIKLLSCTSVKEMVFWYPEQDPTAIKSYPPTVGNYRAIGESLPRCTDFERLTFVNSYIAIVNEAEDPTQSSAHFMIKNVHGTALYKGVDFHRCTGNPKFTGLFFHPDYWKGSGFAGSPTGTDHEDYMAANGIGIDFHTSGQTYAQFGEIVGMKYGVYHTSGDTSIYDMDFLNCATSGFEMVSGKMRAVDCKVEGASYGVNSTAASTEQVYHSCEFSGSTAAVRAETGNLFMGLQKCILNDKVTVNDGVLSIVDCDFTYNGRHVDILSGAIGATILGNRFNGYSFDHSDASSGCVKIDHTQLTFAAKPTYTWADYNTHVQDFKPGTATLFDVATYGAVGDAITDDTLAFQDALDAASAAGGGIVMVGPGWWNVEGTLTIPADVELRGISEGAHDSSEDDTATVLFVSNGEGSASGTAFITMQANSGMRGLAFFYPNQVLPPLAYPFLIRGAGANIYIDDISCTNVSQMIDIATNDCDNAYMENIFASVLDLSYKIGGGSSNIRINTGQGKGFWTYIPNSMKSYYDPDGTTLNAYTSDNMVQIEAGDVTDLVLMACFTRENQYYVKAIDEGGQSPNGFITINNGGEGTVHGYDVTALESNLDIINSQFKVNRSSEADPWKYQLRLDYTGDAKVVTYSTVLDSKVDMEGYIYDGQLEMQAGRFDQQKTQSGFIVNAGASLTMSCHYSPENCATLANGTVNYLGNYFQLMGMVASPSSLYSDIYSKNVIGSSGRGVQTNLYETVEEIGMNLLDTADSDNIAVTLPDAFDKTVKTLNFTARQPVPVGGANYSRLYLDVTSPDLIGQSMDCKFYYTWFVEAGSTGDVKFYHDGPSGQTLFFTRSVDDITQGSFTDRSHTMNGCEFLNRVNGGDIMIEVPDSATISFLNAVVREVATHCDDIGPTNYPPTFNSDPINEIDATEDAGYSSTLADDASDPESDPLTFFKTGGPAWLNVASNGALSGTPTNDDVGLNVFTVQVSATGGSDTATLNITVLNTNDDPSFTSDPINEINATEDAAYSSTLADDATDPDVGDTLFFSLVTGPSWLSIAGDGTLSGTPTTGDVGLNSWTVQVDDDSAAFDQATLEITVDAAGGQLPGQASNPSPSDRARKIQNPVILSWTAGTDATSHDVYFGTDSTPDSGEFQGNQTGTTFDPGSLSGKTNYYWRIDEVNAQGTTTGTVWTFKTK